MTTVDSATSGQIRRAVRADLLAVVRIERTVFEEPWRFSSFEQFLGAPGFLVMEDPSATGIGEDLAGYIVADILEAGDRKIGHVKDLAVKPARQGDGRGRTLLERGVAVLERHGVSTIRLEVRPTNERAIELYRQHGFTRRRRREGYYPDGEDALVMARSADDRDRF